ncbi:hypothetical protein D9619_012841 [Psilocybe cf. subviscida]|uniref:Uncharacterized protein n=1 Tax=Psilocybe cf. subviscida TaxID=2480587 RepID=A0A8H5AR69_9AGAR|nr:hypothetical protein D9619_012841 [Psilocybe cf. subviscida]
MTSASNEALSSGVISWYPRMTPYRLAFFATTGGLGITKAVLVSKNETVSSITVEWITGVVMALVFQFLGSCEYNNKRPQYLDWLFHYNVLGRSNRELGYSHSDSSELGPTGRLSLDQADPSPPLATGYRLLVSAMCAIFGLSKMLCGYLGLRTAMNTLDWIIAVPLTLGLYYIGLYEENESESPRKFFDVDYFPETRLSFQTGVILTIYLSSTVLCILWMRHWLGPLRASLTVDAVSTGGSLAWEASIWSSVIDHLCKWTVVTFYLAMLEIGLVGLGVALWPIIQVCVGRRDRSIRYYALIAAFVTIYAFTFVECISVFVFQLSLYVPLTALVFHPTTEIDISLPVRIILFPITTILMPIFAIPALTVAIVFKGHFDWFRRSIVGYR